MKQCDCEMRSGITQKTLLRRKVNAFNLVHQMQLLEKMHRSDVGSIEDYIVFVFFNLCENWTKLATFRFSGGVEQGKPIGGCLQDWQRRVRSSCQPTSECRQGCFQFLSHECQATSLKMLLATSLLLVWVCYTVTMI